jgi:formate-dependent nitrite reductase cytochrome c552 subunit
MNDSAAVLISNATPINCRGCHLVHVTGTESDLALRSDDPVTLDLTANTFDMGDGNLCANCHQARDGYVIPAVGGADYEVTSEHWGPHHSPQSNMLSNVAGYEVTGSISYPTASRHAAVAAGPLKDGCVSCHMQEAHTDQAGGHTFDLWIEEDEPLTGTCASAGCHDTDGADDWVDFDHDGLQTEIGDLLDDLEALLVTAGALNNTDPTDIHPVEATFTADVAGAMWNYFFVKEDQSHGVHNPQYAKALLTNSVEKLTP